MRCDCRLEATTVFLNGYKVEILHHFLLTYIYIPPSNFQSKLKAFSGVLAFAFRRQHLLPDSGNVWWRRHKLYKYVVLCFISKKCGIAKRDKCSLVASSFAHLFKEWVLYIVIVGRCVFPLLPAITKWKFYRYAEVFTKQTCTVHCCVLSFDGAGEDITDLAILC